MKIVAVEVYIVSKALRYVIKSLFKRLLKEFVKRYFSK